MDDQETGVLLCCTAMYRFEDLHTNFLKVNKRSKSVKTVKNLYEGAIHSVLVTLLKTQFSHKSFSWILNGESKELRILERNFLKILFYRNNCGV